MRTRVICCVDGSTSGVAIQVNEAEYGVKLNIPAFIWFKNGCNICFPIITFFAFVSTENSVPINKSLLIPREFAPFMLIGRVLPNVSTYTPKFEKA